MIASLKRNRPEPLISDHQNGDPNQNLDSQQEKDISFPLKMIKKIHLNNEIEKRKQSIDNFFNESISFNDAHYNLRDIIDNIENQKKSSKNKKNPNSTEKNLNTSKLDHSINMDSYNDSAQISMDKKFFPVDKESVVKEDIVYPPCNLERIQESENKKKLVESFYKKPIS